jgi:excisionase family DNA binding protein
VKEEYLTTREVAQLLRIKERKVYDLAAEGGIPCTRATGKLLFPRAAIASWLERNSSGTVTLPEPRNSVLFAGSHDPLLEWAIRQSDCGIASLFDGSMDGLQRVQDNSAGVAAIHIYDGEHDKWNTPAIIDKLADHPVVLCEWVWRRRGIVSRPDKPVTAMKELKKRTVVGRQAGAGSQILLEHLLSQAGLKGDQVQFIESVRSEADAVVAVLDGTADCTLGLESLATQHGLAFEPVIEEPLDLLVDRRFWFEPAMQQFLQFCRDDAFAAKVRKLPGYRLQKPLRIRFNGGG